MIQNLMANSKFNLIMISAMYENGGNTTHRFLDGHPEIYTYPFESQPGTSLVNDYLSSVFPVKYRWPEFPMNGNVSNDYELIIDEELKRHVKTPFASKFIDADLGFEDSERKKLFLSYMKKKDRSRKNLIAAYYVSTFEAWKSYEKSKKEKYYLGYSPIIGVDADKIFKDYPDAKVIHVVRNPYSAFADTKKRPVPYSLEKYINIWNIVQLSALNSNKLYKDNFIIVRFEDLVNNPKSFFQSLSKKLNVKYSNTMEYPSWNSKKLENIVPWGTIMKASVSSNASTANELSKQEMNMISDRTVFIREQFKYDKK